MIDAIKEIRRPIGLPATDEAIRMLPPETRHPQRWGGVCIPIAFADFDYYYTDGPMNWTPNAGQSLPEVNVPVRFCCDLNSIPQFFLVILASKNWQIRLCGYCPRLALLGSEDLPGCGRRDPYAAMIDSGVSTNTREAINIGVSKTPYFAGRAWNRNTESKKRGEKRILKMFPPRDKITSWSIWSSDPSNFRD